MDHQTSMNSNDGAARGMASGAGAFAYDLTTLAELQTRLFFADAKDCLSRSVLAIVLIVLAGALALASLPVALLGVGYWIQDLTGWPEVAAFALAAGAGLLLAALMLLVAWLKLRSGLRVFRRSGKEFSDNVEWLKHTLKRRGHPMPR